jgi:hypothetical protein
VDRLGNQVHPMIQTLFPNNDAVFQDDNAWKLQHLPWSAQSPDLSTIKTTWWNLKTTVRNRFPPPKKL